MDGAGCFWCVPRAFFDRLDAEFHFTLDAAAADWNARCARYFTEVEDGLAQRWSGVVWVNPPYLGGAVCDWLRKALEESRRGCTVVMLIPSHCDRGWWHDYVLRAAEVRFVRGRVRFVDGVGRSKPTGYGSAVVVFRPGHDGPPVVSSMSRD